MIGIKGFLRKKKMSKYSAGLLMCRKNGKKIEFLIAHPGGPYYWGSDYGVWSLPKGQYRREKEKPLDAAKREFKEETGITPHGPYAYLGRVFLSDKKEVKAWGFFGDADASKTTSSFFPMFWPRGTLRLKFYPEIDKTVWASPAMAKKKLSKSQVPFINRMVVLIPKLEAYIVEKKSTKSNKLVILKGE